MNIWLADFHCCPALGSVVLSLQIVDKSKCWQSQSSHSGLLLTEYWNARYWTAIVGRYLLPPMYAHTHTNTHTHTLIHSLSLTHTHTHTHTRNSPTPCPWQEILPKSNQPSSDESWGRGELDDGGQPRVVLLPAVDQLGHHTVHHVFTLVRATATTGLDAAQTNTHNAGTHCTSRLYLGTGHSHYWAWRCTNKHTQCWHTLYITSLPWYGPQPLLGLTLHKQTHTMLAHTVHHVFTLVRATATTGLDAAQTNTHNAGTHCTSHLYLGTGCSCCWAWSCANAHTMLAHTVHQVFTFVATTGLDAAQTHTLCWHTLYIMSLPWYGPHPLLGLMLHKHTHTHYAGTHCTSRLYLGTGHSHCWAWCCTNTHTMLTHAVHHVFTLVQAAATAGLDAAQTHTLCWQTLFFSFFLSYHLCQPLGHCSCATHPIIPTSSHTQDSFHIAAHHQMSTGGDVKSLVGCHLKKTLHCCRVTSVG